MVARSSIFSEAFWSVPYDQRLDHGIALSRYKSKHMVGANLDRQRQV